MTGGFNVFTTEVEAAIIELDAGPRMRGDRRSARQMGRGGPRVVVADGIDQRGEIIAHAKARLGGVKAPKSVEFVEAIPRTAAGKMDKKALRANYWSDGDRMVN